MQCAFWIYFLTDIGLRKTVLFKLTRIRFLYINVTKILVFHNFFLFQLHFAILFILTDGNFDMKEANYPVNKLFNQTALLIPIILVLPIHVKTWTSWPINGRNCHPLSKRNRNDWWIKWTFAKQQDGTLLKTVTKQTCKYNSQELKKAWRW